MLASVGLGLVLGCGARNAAQWARRGIELERDISYGSADRQKFDVYLPASGYAGAPVIFMVHGGGWAAGDKSGIALGANKVTRWVPKGVIVVSTNYRLIPEADPIEQARDVARSLAAAQSYLGRRGVDRTKWVLMGHSAGAHLVALLTAAPSLADGLEITPWLATIPLDIGAYDVVELMGARHASLFDRAFGADPAYWRAASPLHRIDDFPAAHPRASLLLVCSSRRDGLCEKAERFADKCRRAGFRVGVRDEPLGHMRINSALGQSNAYTRAVEAFLSALDPAFSQRLR